jgi:FtsZ-binding cell division protein ZapB
MSATDWATIGATVIVAVISALAALASQRSARNAAHYSANSSVMNERIKAETDAYNRARKMDIETIERQDKEIEELRQRDEVREIAIRDLRRDNEKLHIEAEQLRRDNAALQRRVAVLEQQGETS